MLKMKAKHPRDSEMDLPQLKNKKVNISVINAATDPPCAVRDESYLTAKHVPVFKFQYTNFLQREITKTADGRATAALTLCLQWKI
ncbi:hypothetical protein KP79_PYT01021 [Mizuhopecten yessoensis]|uniref:Uncharacterized protein n=1 Tax=Mizuhopecten yessoensis TaxID=6573 RepID=A0A210QLQ6_MIZYE|nr:hypothetical protein KP79_PYT01021 [Mizuhopecten yessoensis]